MHQQFSIWPSPSKLATFSLVAFAVCLVIFSPFGSVNANYLVSNLSNSPGHSLNQRIIQSNGSTYFVWTDTGDQSNDTGQIHFRTSNDSGNRFSETSILSNVTADSNLPDISATGNNVYVTWEDDSSENSRIFFRGSHNNGRIFDKILDISNGTIGASLQNIASYKNSVYIVWIGSKPEDPKNFEVFLRKSNDYGRNFGPIIDLSKSAGDSIDPHIVVPRNEHNVYVIYTDCDAVHDDPLCGIYFIKSSDSGIRFGSPTLISIVSSTNPYLPSLGHSHPPITSSLLPAFGMNTQKQIDEHNSIIPVITSSEDGKDVYVLWQDDLTRTGATDIFFRKSNDYGNTFGDSINLSDTP
ncbi:MAG: sialidase family protein, partial [Nitrososphaeraceae archaeon]